MHGDMAVIWAVSLPSIYGGVGQRFPVFGRILHHAYKLMRCEMFYFFWQFKNMIFLNITGPATCLPHTGFAGVWTPATHAELICHRTIHKHGSTLVPAALPLLAPQCRRSAGNPLPRRSPSAMPPRHARRQAAAVAQSRAGQPARLPSLVPQLGKNSFLFGPRPPNLATRHVNLIRHGVI